MTIGEATAAGDRQREDTRSYPLDDREALARRYLAERQRVERAEQLWRIGRELHAELDLAHQLATLQRHILQLSGLVACWVASFDEEADTVILCDPSGQIQHLPARFSPQGRASAQPTTMYEALFSEGRPILTDDYLAECRRRNFQPVGPQSDQPGCAWIGVPLRIGERVIGALAAWYWDGPIDAEAIELLQILAEQSATALDNARRYAVAEQRHREEAAFNAIAQDLAVLLDGATVIERIAYHARNLVGGDVGQIMLHDPASDRLRLQGFSSDIFRARITELPTDEGMGGYIWRTGQQIVATDYPTDTRFATPTGVRTDPHARGWASAIGVPIALGEERLGVLQIGTATRRHFTARDGVILTRLAAQAALAVRNARLFAAERERAARAEVLREIGRDLSANLDLDRLLDAIQRHLVRLVGPENFWVALLDEENACLRTYLWVEEGEWRVPAETVRALPLVPSLIATILAEQRAIITDDYVAECRRHGVAPRGPSADRPGRAWGCFPLIVGGKAIGALAAWRWDAPLAPEICETLELFTGQIATALDNARLYEAAERQRREEVAFGAIARDLATSLDGDTILQRITAHTRALLGVTSARLLLYDAATGLLRVAAGSGGEFGRFIGYTSTPEQGLTGLIWRTRRPFSTSDYADDDRFAHLPDFDRWSKEHRMQSVLGVPILLGDNPLGVLVVIAYEARQFTARDEMLLSRLADQAALAVHNARLYGEAQERAARLEVLTTIAHELSAEIDFERFLTSIWRHVHRITPVDGCWVALWHEVAEELQFCVYVEDGQRHPEWETTLARASGTGLAWAVMAEQAPLRVADYNAECHRRGLIPNGSDPERPNSPWLGIPLQVNGRIVGAMALWRRQRLFADDEMTTIVTLANQIAAMLENARLYQEARTLAMTDPLTGLLNHRHMHERLDQELTRAARHDQSLAVVMLDLDNFKLFNDTYGHPAGDQVLRATAAILRASARTGDIIARYGGDEFCLILPETTRDGALLLVERVQAHCHSLGTRAEPHQSLTERADDATSLRASAGIAVYPHDAKDRHELVTRADAALYANKRGGRALAAADHQAGQGADPTTDDQDQ